MRALDRDDLAPPSSASLVRIRARIESTRLPDLFVPVIALLATFTAVPWLNRPMFRDEAATIYSAHLGWSQLLRQSGHVDFVLLPYYAIMHFWLYFSGSVVWGRLFSAAAYGLTVYMTGFVATRIGGRTAGVIAAVLCATNPSMFHSAIYLRPYALGALAAVLASMAIIEWIRGGDDRLFWLFAAATVATLLLQLFSALAPLSVLFAAAAMNPARFRASWQYVSKPLAIVAVAMALFLPVAASQHQQVAWIKLNFFTNRAYLGPAGGSATYERLMIILFLGSAIACLAEVALGGAKPSRKRVELVLAIASWSALPTALLITASLVLQPVFILRYVTASAPGLAILVALMLARAVRLAANGSTWRLLSVAGAGVATAVLLFAAGSVTTGNTVHENFRAASEYLAANVQPGDVVALPDHSITTAVNYYLARRHVDLPAWPQIAHQYQIEGLDLSLDPPAELASPPPGVWLVEDGSTRGLSAFKEALLSQGYVLLEERSFKQAKVLLYRVW